MNLKENPFHFTKVSENVISDFLKELKTNKATGIDNLPGRFLKDESKVLATLIAQSCNLSIKPCAVPDECKFAKLKPLQKKGKKTDRKNNRPISLLSVISKILEKVIQDQTLEFVTKNNVLYKFQSGFRNFLYRVLSLGFLLDSCHSTDSYLLSMGFSNDVKKWFEYYLTKRMFSVNIENSFSDKSVINCGGSQKSNLGPLLFLLYVNDMVQVMNCDILIYNDSGLIFQHKDMNIIEHQPNKNFSNICDWFVDNKFSIYFVEYSARNFTK